MQNTAKLKLFAQQTRLKLRDFVQAKLTYVFTADTAELRGKTNQINKLREEIKQKGEDGVVEEVAYTWFNRVMALRYMDSNGYNTPMIVTPAEGQLRPEILQEALGGVVDDSLGLSPQEKLLPEESLYRHLLVASCNQLSASMPSLFERIQDYTELLLPDDLLTDQSFVTDIRRGMTDEDCQNVEIIGWLYQFYIADRKADAEAKKSKKGGLKSDEQAAATQLFTPHWIVRYMVENTVGRIWMTLHPASPLREEMKYYIDPVDGQAEPIPEHIHSVKDITFLDPCMGSGHILIYAFILFAKMYEEEGYRKKEIPQLIIENNLYGMDIDRRCYQLASFAITMTACRYFGKRYLRHAVAPKVIALQSIPHDVIDATGSWPSDSLMWQFEHIDTIGSLLKVTPEDYEQIHVHEGIFGGMEQLMKDEAAYLSKRYDCVVTNPPYLGKGFDAYLKSYVNAQYPKSKADLMATFMERCLEYCAINGKMSMINMQSWMFLSSFEQLRKELLETVQIDSMLHLGPHTFDELSGEVVQNTAFVVRKINDANESECIGAYYRLVEGKNCADKKRMFLENRSGNIDGAKVYFPNVKQKEFEKIPRYPIGYWLSPSILDLFNFDVLDLFADIKVGNQTGNNSKYIMCWFEVSQKKTSLEYYDPYKKWFPYNKGGGARWFGNRYFVVDWEKDGYDIKNEKDEKGSIRSVIRNASYHFRECLSYGRIGTGNLNVRFVPKGAMFDINGPSIFSRYSNFLVMAYLNSNVAQKMLEIICPTLTFQVGDVSKIPFILDISKDQELAIEGIVADNIFLSKLDWDSHETSWDFQETPLVAIMKEATRDASQTDGFKSENQQFQTEKPIVSISETDSFAAENNVQQGEVKDYQATLKLLKKLVGDSTTRDASTPTGTLEHCVNAFEKLWTARFMQLHANEEELNRQFIDIYGLQDELTPDVPLSEITILQQGEISIEDGKVVWHEDVIIKQLLSYLVGCFMGRYSVDRPGLIIADQHVDLSALGLQVDGHPETPHSTITIDDDGIIPVIAEENYFADDMTERVSAAVKAVFGEDYFEKNIRYIEHTLGKSLRDYFFKDFYADHVQMYSVKGDRRPIYWLFSSRMGDRHKRGYFRALVYMHRMEADTLSQLHATYVAPYLKKAEMQLREAENELTRDDLTGAQRNKANRKADELRSKVREVKEFETKLVEMASHRTTIDLDDGVKANYPLFYPLVEPVKGLDKQKQKD